MSIASELTNLAANRDAIKAAIESKGGTAVSNTLAAFPAAIESIPSGGSSPVPREWVPPSEWPNLRTLIAEDSEDYEKKMYMLFDSYACPSVPNVISAYAPGSAMAKTSDGATYMSDATHVWSQDPSYGRYRWVAFYATTRFSKVLFGRSYSRTDSVILWIVLNAPFVGLGDPYKRPEFKGEYPYNLQAIECPSVTINDSSNNYAANRMFVSASSLRKVPDIIDVSVVGSAGNMFGECRSLLKVPSVLNISNATNTNSMFSNCINITSVPDVLDISNSTNTSYMFNGCLSLKAVPDVLDASKSTNTSFMFCNCVSLEAVKNLDISASVNTSSLFSGCQNLRSVPAVLDTSSSTSTSNMFYFCQTLTSVPAVLDLSKSTNTSGMFYSCYSLEAVPSVLDLSSSTNTNAMFINCYSLKAVPSVLDLSSSTNTGLMFNNCLSLVSVPSTLDLSKSTNVGGMFQGCYMLEALPDVIDLSSVTSAANQNRFVEGCFALQRLPTHVTSKWSLSFSWCANIRDRDSVCTFSNGAVSGGFVGNLNTCPNNGQTITLNSYVKGLFDSTEQSLIAAAITAKNWTLSW